LLFTHHRETAALGSRVEQGLARARPLQQMIDEDEPPDVSGNPSSFEI